MRVTQVYLETHSRRQHCSLPLHHQQPTSSSSIPWFHKLTRGHKWVMLQTLSDLEETAVLWKIWKIKCILPLAAATSVFGFCTRCSLANEGSHNHTFVYLRYVCKCYPQGAGCSLALLLSGSHGMGWRDAGRWCRARGLEACAPGHRATVCPQHLHTGAFIQCHIHAPETSHRMSLAQPGFVQSCLGMGCGNFIACYEITSWSILSGH